MSPLVRIAVVVLIGVVLVGTGVFVYLKQTAAPEKTAAELAVELAAIEMANNKPAVSATGGFAVVPVLKYGSANIYSDNTYRYIESDGLPNHETGAFPNPGNSNSISAQEHRFRIIKTPVYTGTSTPTRLPGVALNGIPLEPGTAEFFNNDRTSGWNVEAFFNGVDGLGIDDSNAHVQPNGTYHYHAVPEGLLTMAKENQTGDLIQLAWAADGFPIYHSLAHAYNSSYQLKAGTRADGPGGEYDGTYTEDWEFVAGLGELDECNGTFVDGKYAYFMTDTFPYLPRCLMGTPDPSFETEPGAGSGGPTGDNAPRLNPPTGGAPAGGPPAEAIAACASQSQGASCTIITPQGSVSGICQTPPSSDQLACVPPR